MKRRREAETLKKGEKVPMTFSSISHPLPFITVSLSLFLFLSLDVHIGAVNIAFLFVDQSKRIDLIKMKEISRRCIG